MDTRPNESGPVEPGIGDADFRRLGFAVGRRRIADGSVVEIVDAFGGELVHDAAGVGVIVRETDDGIELVVIERVSGHWMKAARRNVCSARELREALLWATERYFRRVESAARRAACTASAA
jgi:hypothetical protein